jgi:hypothetical protein
MVLKEPQEGWPIIGQSDVSNVCQQICESIVGLERAFEAGELSSRLTSGCFEQVLGPQLYETYGKLADSAPGPLNHLRIDAVCALLVQLQNDLVPTQIAHAQVRMPTEGASWGSEPGTNSPTSLRFKFVDASFDGAPSTALRFDQMIDARFWRIGFTFETLDLCDAFAREVVRSATRRLASELLGLQRILERFRPQALKRELKIAPYPSDRRFEHLMLDILNEDDRHVNVAPLLEDFLEKTDLRVKYPWLKRRRGARVQVTSIVAPELHKAKREGIKLAEEFVFLSPLSLAEYVRSLQTRNPADPKSWTPSFALAPLWDCLEAKPADVPQLASELKRIMFSALTTTPDSPLGPMVRVPQPVRQLIRLFVETHALASTSKLRERERNRSSDPCVEGNGFGDDKASLHELWRVMGLPGKPDGIAGADVTAIRAFLDRKG